MATTINGTTFTETVSNTVGARYLEGQPIVGIREYERENIASPGADGTNQKNFGFRGTKIRATLAFIEASCPACISAVATFANSCVPARISATFAGISMNNVEVIAVTPDVPFVIIGEGGVVMAKVVVEFQAVQRKL